MPLTAVPVNRPLSSVTVGPVDGVGVEAAKTVATAAQIAISDARRKAMIARREERFASSKGYLVSGLLSVWDSMHYRNSINLQDFACIGNSGPGNNMYTANRCTCMFRISEMSSFRKANRLSRSTSSDADLMGHPIRVQFPTHHTSGIIPPEPPNKHTCLLDVCVFKLDSRVPGRLK